jgi:hypothetical protein
MTPATRPIRLVPVLLALLVFGCSPDARAQTADALFDPTVVHELRLFINARDLAELREKYLENTYYPADLHWGDLRVRNVGVRSRGTGSRNQNKLGLRIDVNRFVSGQRLAGLTSIVLDNLIQDPSMLRDRTAMAFFARMGLPHSRISFARLYVNNELEGIYGIVEEVDSNYLRRNFGSNDGFLFEYHHLREYRFEDLGDELEPYAAMFEPRTNERSAPSVLYSAIREIVRPEADPVVWRAHIERYVDLPQFIAMVAVERFLAEFDGLTGYAGLNNFYLYRLPDSDRHVFLPWDRDNALRDDAPPVLEGLTSNHLLRQAFEFPDLAAHYRATLERAIALAEQDGWLVNHVAQTGGLLAPHVPADARKPYTDLDHAGAVAHLTAFARRRPADVRAQLAAAPAAAR